MSGGRSRFGNVVHLDDVPDESYGRDTRRYGETFRAAAAAIGARDLGYSVTSVDPGKRSCPFHFHHSEEEAFYVLSGRGDVAEYPDSDKVMIRAGRMMLRRAPQLDYLDGED